MKIAFPTLAADPDRNSVINARNAGQRFANQMTPIQLKTALTIPGVGGVFGLDSGGTAPPGGGLVAEKRPEILNSRYLATQPTIVPAGTRVHIGSTHGHASCATTARPVCVATTPGMVVNGPAR